MAQRMVDVTGKKVYRGNGEVVTHMSKTEIPIAELYRMMASALAMRENIEDAIDSMKQLIQDKEQADREALCKEV